MSGDVTQLLVHPIRQRPKRRANERGVTIIEILLVTVVCIAAVSGCPELAARTKKYGRRCRTHRQVREPGLLPQCELR